MPVLILALVPVSVLHAMLVHFQLSKLLLTCDFVSAAMQGLGHLYLLPALLLHVWYALLALGLIKLLHPATIVMLARTPAPYWPRIPDYVYRVMLARGHPFLVPLQFHHASFVTSEHGLPSGPLFVQPVCQAHTPLPQGRLPYLFALVVMPGPGPPLRQPQAC
jgi:hypothetical protein